MTLTIRDAAYAIIPIASNLSNERIWAYPTDNPIACALKGLEAGTALHETSKIFHDLPIRNYSYAFALLGAAVHTEKVKNTPIGPYLSKGVNTFFEAIHLAEIYGDHVSGKKLQASVRMISWAYFHTPQKMIPTQLQKMMATVVKIATGINLAVFIYKSPLGACALVAVVTAVVASYSFIFKNDPAIREQHIKEGMKGFVDFVEDPWGTTKKYLLD